MKQKQTQMPFIKGLNEKVMEILTHAERICHHACALSAIASQSFAGQTLIELEGDRHDQQGGDARRGEGGGTADGFQRLFVQYGIAAAGLNPQFTDFTIRLD